MKQTAIEWLYDKWSNCKEWKWEEIEQWFEQAKEMEKQQIKDAWNNGAYCGDMINIEISEDYYNETYGSKGSDETKLQQLTSSQTEISDEEIEDRAAEWMEEDWDVKTYYEAFIDGASWYKEQLKSRQ